MRIFAGDAFLNKRFRLYIGTDAVLEHPPKSALLLVSQDLAWVGHLTTSPMAVSQLTKKRRRQRGEQKFIGDACFPRFDRASTPEPPISLSSYFIKVHLRSSLPLYLRLLSCPCLLLHHHLHHPSPQSLEGGGTSDSKAEAARWASIRCSGPRCVYAYSM